MQLASSALIAMLAVSGFALAPSRAFADPARDVALAVQAPPDAECSSAARLRALVEKRVGSIVFLDPDNVRRTINVEIRTAENAPGFSATLVLRDAQSRMLGERVVNTASTTCDSLEPMLVLVISTLIGLADAQPAAAPRQEPARDDELGKHRSGGATAAPPAQPPAVSTRTQSTIADTPVSGPRMSPPTMVSAATERLRLSLGLSAQAVTGLLPGVAPLGAVDLMARYGALEVRAGVSATPLVGTDLGGGARSDFFVFLGQAQACGVATEHLGGPLSFCAGAKAGGLSAQTQGLFQNAQTFRAVVLLLAEASLQVSVLRQHALLFGLGATVPVLAPSYYYLERVNERRDFHTVEPGLFAEFGWLWRFTS